MNDLSIRVTAVDMASNVLAAVGENVKSMGQSASSAFDSMARSGQNASAAANTAGESSTMIIGGTGAIAKLGGALLTVVGGALAAGAAVAAFGVVAMRAAIKAEKELGKVGKTLKLIEAQRLNIPVEMIGSNRVNELLQKAKAIEAKRLNIPVEMVDTNELLKKVKEAESKRLNIPVEFVGIDAGVDSMLQKVKLIADQIENSIGTKSSKIVDLASSATKQGFDPGQIDQTMKGAAGLASAFGISLEEGLSRVRQAAEGNFTAFEVLIPGIQNLSTDQEKLAAVSKLAADGLTLSIDAANRGDGIFTKLGNGIGNLLERIGSLSSVTEITAGVMGEILFPVIDFVDKKLFALGETGDWLKDSLKTSFAFISAVAQTTWNNMGLLLERAKLSFFLFSEQSVLAIEHAFTVSMPAYVIWFTDNFFNLLQDMSVGALTIVSNLGLNIADAFGEYWHFITEGWSQGESLGDLAGKIGEIATRNLLDGFEPVTQELPKIAERAMSSTEKHLLEQMAGIDVKLANDFTKAFQNSLAEIDSELASAKLDTKINLGKVKPPDASSLIPQNVEAKVNQAFESRVQVRGPSEDKLSKSVAVQEKMLEQLIAIADAKDAAVNAATSAALAAVGGFGVFDIEITGN